MNCDARHVLFSKQSGWYLARGTNIYFIFPLPLKRNVVFEVSFDFLSKLKLNLFKIPYENIFHRDNHINSSYRHSSLSRSIQRPANSTYLEIEININKRSS